MGLLQQLNFSRSVILFSFVGSAVLGYFVWQKQQEVETYRDALASQSMATGVYNNVKKARELEELMETASRENFGSSASDLEQYIIRSAQNPKVQVGKVDIGAPDEDEVVTGLVDVKFKVTPSRGGKESFQLAEISNFAYQLEQAMRAVKVTRLKIVPAATNKGVKEHDVLDDRWKFELEARVRIKKDE
jgi:hypothetical protein